MRREFMKRPALVGAFLIALAGTRSVLGQREIIIHVVLNEDDAAAARDAAGSETLVVGLGKALKQVPAALGRAGRGGQVVLKVSRGEEKGDPGLGGYQLPLIQAPNATLEIRGGYAPDFRSRNPFRNPTLLTTIDRRERAMFEFARQSKLKGFILDGVLIDVAESNAYGADENNLLAGSSSSRWMFRFNYLETDLLAFRNCVFLNAGMRVCEPLIRAASDDAVIEISNNLIINNRIPFKLDTARYRHQVKQIIVRNNSFLRNWAYNPDRHTGNPAAVELAGPASAASVLIEGNLFHGNFGGALFQPSPAGPPVVLRGNDFYHNGGLHGDADPGAVALIVHAKTVNGDPSEPFIPLHVTELSRPAFLRAEANVSIHPGFDLQMRPVRIGNDGPAAGGDREDEETDDFEADDYEDADVALSGYAPRFRYDPAAPPLATGKAAAYGAHEVFAR